MVDAYWLKLILKIGMHEFTSLTLSHRYLYLFLIKNNLAFQIHDVTFDALKGDHLN